MILSIGGWTYSPSFHPVVVDPRLRSKFVASAIRLVEDNGLDGLDIDYEYPQNEHQARGYVDLLRELRYALDAYALRKGANYRFLLTVRILHSPFIKPHVNVNEDRCPLRSRQLQEALRSRNGSISRFLEHDGV